jgi:hypothetical protein
LHLGRGSVDLVGQNDVGEDRAFLDAELPGVGLVDERPDEVRRQQVRGELDPLVAGLDAGGQARDRRGLGQPRHPLDQQVPVAEQPDQHPVEQVVLAHDDPVHLVPQGRKRPARGLDLFGDVLDVQLGGGHGSPVLLRLMMRRRRRGPAAGRSGFYSSRRARPRTRPRTPSGRPDRPVVKRLPIIPQESGEAGPCSRCGDAHEVQWEPSHVCEEATDFSSRALPG